MVVLDRPTPVQLDTEFKSKLMEFVNALNVEPDKEKEVKIRKHDKVKYVPIEVVEAKLNQYFSGLWQTFNFKYQVIVNELVGDLELAIYHPVAGVWLRRSGTGAVLIQQRAEYEVDDKGNKVKKSTDVLDVSRKISNTLEKDMGHLKADCIKNAAKSLGISFGANILRDVENGDAEFIDPSQAEQVMATITSKKDLKLYYQGLPAVVANDKRIQNVLKRRQLELEIQTQSQ